MGLRGARQTREIARRVLDDRRGIARGADGHRQGGVAHAVAL